MVNHFFSHVLDPSVLDIHADSQVIFRVYLRQYVVRVRSRGLRKCLGYDLKGLCVPQNRVLVQSRLTQCEALHAPGDFSLACAGPGEEPAVLLERPKGVEGVVQGPLRVVHHVLCAGPDHYGRHLRGLAVPPEDRNASAADLLSRHLVRMADFLRNGRPQSHHRGRGQHPCNSPQFELRVNFYHHDPLDLQVVHHDLGDGPAQHQHLHPCGRNVLHQLLGDFLLAARVVLEVARVLDEHCALGI